MPMNALAVALTCFAVPSAATAQDRFVNAQVTSRDGRDLKAVVESVKKASPGPSWIGYAVPGAQAHAIAVARGDPGPRVRGQALFWLGQPGDPRALALFEEILKER